MATTVKSKNSAARNKRLGPARPFDPAILARAEALAAQYQIVLWTEDGEFYGRGVEMPMAMGDGPTPDACVASTREAFAAVLAYMIESGEAPPPPAGDGRPRTEQVNVRLTPDEKLVLEAAAERQGFRGVSDFVRAAAIGRAQP